MLAYTESSTEMVQQLLKEHGFQYRPKLRIDLDGEVTQDYDPFYHEVVLTLDPKDIPKDIVAQKSCVLM